VSGLWSTSCSCLVLASEFCGHTSGHGPILKSSCEFTFAFWDFANLLGAFLSGFCLGLGFHNSGLNYFLRRLICTT